MNRKLSVVFYCCIPAVPRWRTYHRCCSGRKAELELCEGRLAPKITRRTKYIEFIVNK